MVSLDEIVQVLSTDNGMAIASATFAAGAAVGALLRGLYDPSDHDIETDARPAPGPEDEEPSYPLQRIAALQVYEGDCSIKGTVRSLSRSSEGFAGIISDESGQLPFYFSDDSVDTFEHEGLAAALLGAAVLEPVELLGAYDPDLHMFVAHSLRHKLGNALYELGEAYTP